jgi:hypothetical protein
MYQNRDKELIKAAAPDFMKCYRFFRAMPALSVVPIFISCLTVYLPKKPPIVVVQFFFESSKNCLFQEQGGNKS